MKIIYKTFVSDIIDDYGDIAEVMEIFIIKRFPADSSCGNPSFPGGICQALPGNYKLGLERSIIPSGLTSIMRVFIR